MKKIVSAYIFAGLAITLSTIMHINLLAKNPTESISDFILVDGSKLNYVIEGEGIQCLVIGSSIYYPKTFSKNLLNHLKMYFVDMKWFAKEYMPENLDSVNIQSIVDDVEEIRIKLGLKDPLIMGHSIHGSIAMEYVKKFHNEVSGIVIIGSPAQFGNEFFKTKTDELWATASDERKAIQKENWGQLNEIDRLTGKEATAAAYNRSSPQYWYDPYYDANWLWDGMTVHTDVTNNLFGNVFQNYNMFEGPVTIPIPVFVAMGIYDYVIPYTLWEKEYDNIPDFNLFLFEKSGHTPQLEEAEVFDMELLKWLNSKIN